VDRYGGRISAAELVAGTATLPEPNRVREGERRPVDGLAVRRRTTPAILGLTGIVIAFIGIAAMFAFEQAPFYDADEKAQLGYAHEIADLRLPEIERQPDVPASATQWQVERSTARDSRYLGVWVANHPPLHYVAVAPLIWFSEITERADGGLLLMRLANIAFAATGVAFTYLLAKEVSGGERRVGLAAAAIVALVPQGHTYFSRGLNDGIAFAAGTALVWAGVRALRSPLERRNLALLGVTAAAAAGTRTATMLLAVVVVAVVSADRLVRPPGTPAPVRRRAAAVTAAVGIGPAVVLFGWFYLRIQRLYGDIGASSFLLDRFDRTGRGTIAHVLTQGRLWSHLYHRMISTAPLSWAWPRFVNLVAVVAVIGLVVAIARPRMGTSRRAIALCLVAVAVITFTVAQHLSGGGSAYPRYFFPVLGVLSVLAAIGLDRLVPGVLPALVVGAMAWWAIRQMPIGVNPAITRRPRDGGAVPPPALRVLPVGEAWRMAAAGLIVLGTVLVIAAGCLALVRWRRPTVP
jgi:hypothetical protein